MDTVLLTYFATKKNVIIKLQFQLIVILESLVLLEYGNDKQTIKLYTIESTTMNT